MMEAVKSDEIFETERKRQFCSFWLSGRLFGVDILDVKEINSEITFTPIFHASKEVKGYVNIRGQIHLVIDLRLLLGFERADDVEGRRLIIFKTKVGEPFGVQVDRIGDVVEVTEGQIEQRTKVDDKLDRIVDSGDVIEGVCKLKDRLLVILNAKSFLRIIEKGRGR
ncbi:MAG: chemotaxis protein CheW [Deltaproteobacteria bacterium]|nr:chemotaxis protein CheW [Deltaproteobacteria bacterium]